MKVIRAILVCVVLALGASGCVLFGPKLQPTKHWVGHGDTLERLALRYYHDAKKTNLILQANPKLDPKMDPKKQLKVGIDLVVPIEFRDE